MPQSDDITLPSNTFLASIAANPDNPVNDEEPILKPSPVKTNVNEPNVKSLSEKNPLLGQYIFTNSLLIKRAPSVSTSVKSDPPGSTSNKIKKETLVPTNNIFKNEVKKEAFVATDNENKNELLYVYKVNQEVDHKNKYAMQLLSKICYDMKELQIIVQKHSNKKKSIMAPTIEEL